MASGMESCRYPAVAVKTSILGTVIVRYTLWSK